MLRARLLVIASAVMLVASCRTRIVYRDSPCDAPPGADALDATSDAPADASRDAPPDALADATVPTCTTADDLADHLEPIGGFGGNPQMSVDAFGAVAVVGGNRIAFLGANGQKRMPDIVLAFTPVAIAFDGLDYRVVEQAVGTVQVRTMTIAGTLSEPTVIGLGTAVWGGLAVHASGDVAVMWNATVDGSLQATVLPVTGAAVHTILDIPPTLVNTQLVGGVVATQSATARFIVAYAKVAVTANDTTVWARTLAPTGAEQLVSTGALKARHRVGAAPGATADSALIAWRDDTSVHAVTFHASSGIVVADRAVITPAAGYLTRVAGRSGPGTGFEILVDHGQPGGDRALILHGFTAAGDPVGTPRRIATICTNAYSEENLAFVRNASVRYVTWYDLTLPDNLTGAF